MYRSPEDSLFSCFTSKSCKTPSRAGHKRCRKTAKITKPRSHIRRSSPTLSQHYFQTLVPDLSHREKQIRSEICFLPRDHRLLLQPSSNRSDQLGELFAGRGKQARIEYKPLASGNYFHPSTTTTEGTYPKNQINLYHSVVAFSTLFFTLLLIISSISTSMTVQGEDRTTNGSQSHPSLLDSNVMQPSGLSFRPRVSGQPQRSRMSSARTQRSLYKRWPSSNQTLHSITSSTPQKLTNNHIFKYSRKRSSRPGRMTMYNNREKWLEISTGDKFSIKSLEEKHRFLRFLNISNETKLTLFIPVKNIDLNLSNATRDASPIMSALVRRPTGRKRVQIQKRADRFSDLHLTSSSNGHVNKNNNSKLSIASLRGRQANDSRSRTRHRKDVESSMMDSTMEEEERRHSRTDIVDDNQTTRPVLHWDVDNPDMLEEECFTTPFKPLYSDLHFLVEHSSTECLQDESPPSKSKSDSTTFERYDERQRETALNICKSFDQRRDDREPVYLPFCSHLKIMDALENEGKDCFTADPTHRRDEVCPPCVERLLKFDQNAKSIHCLFEIAVSYYNCEDMYSKTARCDQCKAAHKLWICSLLIPHYSNENRIPACPHYEQIVENRCPYLSPHNNNQYAGEAMFQSKNDRASINEVLMMKEDVRPTCHYPCLLNHSIDDQGQTYDRIGPHPVDDSSRDGVKRSSSQRMSVCLSHELDTAPDWSFDQEDALLLDLELQRQTNT